MVSQFQSPNRLRVNANGNVFPYIMILTISECGREIARFLSKYETNIILISYTYLPMYICIYGHAMRNAMLIFLMNSLFHTQYYVKSSQPFLNRKMSWCALINPKESQLHFIYNLKKV